VDTEGEDHCFAEGTMVDTPSGPVRIGDLAGSDPVVMSVAGPVQAFACRLTRRLAPVVRVVFEGGTSIVCTPDHRFETVGGWVEAKDLRDAVQYKHEAQSAGRSWQTLRVLRVEPDGLADVYCLTVPGGSAFTVEGGISVHNCGDDTRYGCMARPLSRVPKPRQVNGPKPFTLDWVMSQGQGA
jgi:hypothetical protein